MVRKMLKVAVILMGLVWSMNASGQIHSKGLNKDGKTYGSADWVAGTPPFALGLQECEYYTDESGRYVFVLSSTPKPNDPDFHYHRKTVVYLGATSYSLPFRRSAVVIFSLVFMAGILVLGDWVLKKFRRGAVPAEK